MKIVTISDTHSLHLEMGKLPEGDILIHSGDISNIGENHDIINFINWFMGIEGFKYKIFIAGNHDFGLEIFHKPGPLYDLLTSDKFTQSNCVYLMDSHILIESPDISRPLKVYGSPWQPFFYNWAFNLPRNGNALKEKWDMIPDDTDILITHGPPFGILDITPRKDRTGCELLTNRLINIKPILHVFGHIHDSYGTHFNGDTFSINASICTERYYPTNQPIVVDIIEVDGKLKVI